MTQELYVGFRQKSIEFHKLSNDLGETSKFLSISVALNDIAKKLGINITCKSTKGNDSVKLTHAASCLSFTKKCLK